ncbi:MAG TPA: FAD-dependent oxidoreductase [Bacteroidales bacterium]|nr:FAD-dependent oxidoreductase [Bacteroidales bacterium]
MNWDVVVVGGGTAGMEASGQLAKAGYNVTLFEKEEEAGGHLKNWYHLFPDRRDGEEVITYLNDQINNDNITFYKGSRIDHLEKNEKKFIIKTNEGKEMTADAIIIATGFDLFRSERKEEYGYGIYDNVITSADLEKRFRTGDMKMNNGEIPRRIGIVHCVGSRDEKVGNLYCSKLCCVTAVKQAIEISEWLPESKVFCFYMDIRMGGALYEELYMESQEKYGVNYIRGKVSEVGESFTNSLIVKVEDTLAGRPLKMELDMLVLMAGMEISEGSKKIGKALGLKTGENRFFQSRDNHFGSNLSNIDGLFYAGTCTAPMNITETISHARAAVLDVMDYLKDGRR